MRGDLMKPCSQLPEPQSLEIWRFEGWDSERILEGLSSPEDR